MLYYDRIYSSSAGIDINQISASKECDICHFGIFQIKSSIFDCKSAMDPMIY